MRANLCTRQFKRRIVRGVVIALAVAATGCASTPGGAQATSSPTPPAKPGQTDNSAVVRPSGNFTEWKATFRARALAEGIDAQTFDTAFAGVKVNARVLELDRYQPEFTRPIWEYLDRAVSESRIADGRARSAEQRATLAAITDKFGVDMGVVAAIWGIESAYGHDYGSIPVIESLATLAFEGRRQAFAEGELLAALRILQSGDVSPSRMIGSWAGAMGHTQFIPTSFQAYAVDFTGDGKRDVWASNPADALASTANYLARFGWTRGAPAVVEVTLPKGFDYRLADDHTRNNALGWEAMGVTKRDGGALPPSDQVTILLPAGAGGPTFAAYPNFRVIKRYNNATSYALAVALLAAELDPGIRFGLSRYIQWPRDDRPLSNRETIELQQRLTALGYSTQGADGIIGPNTRAAIRDFQAANGLVPDGYVSAALLEKLRSAG